MLTFYAAKSKGPLPTEAASATPDRITWIDAYDPTPEERATLEKLMGAEVPTLDDLLEIETSSRLAVEDGALVMSLPATAKDETGYPVTTPLGFVVNADKVASLRFARLPSFEHLSKRICDKGDLSEGGFGAAVTVIEIIVDHIADLLERIGGDLDATSRSIFSGGLMETKHRRPHHSNRLLTALLEKIGRNADLVSKVSETLLGLSRMAPFLSTNAKSNLTADLERRIEMVSADTKSLHEYQDHLANKTQFLLDTVLGLVNIEQNNVFRVLTVVSVIGIPPTFFASMWGMNFKSMPELDWPHGYAYALTVIALSAVLPALWFKVKGWW